MTTSVRRALRAESAEIAGLVKNYWAFESIDGFSHARITGMLNSFISHPERGCCWVAGESGALCGYLLASYVFSLEHGGMMAEIDELFVMDECRSSGTGTRLLREAMAQMKAKGLVRVQMQLGISNSRGRQFYMREGFATRSGYELWDRPLQI